MVNREFFLDYLNSLPKTAITEDEIVLLLRRLNKLDNLTDDDVLYVATVLAGCGNPLLHVGYFGENSYMFDATLLLMSLVRSIEAKMAYDKALARKDDTEKDVLWRVGFWAKKYGRGD